MSQFRVFLVVDLFIDDARRSTPRTTPPPSSWLCGELRKCSHNGWSSLTTTAKTATLSHSVGSVEAPNVENLDFEFSPDRATRCLYIIIVSKISWFHPTLLPEWRSFRKFFSRREPSCWKKNKGVFSSTDISRRPRGRSKPDRDLARLGCCRFRLYHFQFDISPSRVHWTGNWSFGESRLGKHPQPSYVWNGRPWCILPLVSDLLGCAAIEKHFLIRFSFGTWSFAFYSWFSGNWKVRSKTLDVQAPCGVAFFGGNNTFNKAKNDIGNVLLYESRFVKDASDRTVADREYNVKSIAKVAMGENSVVNVALSTPNKFSCLLAPKGSPSMLTVDLIVLNRREEQVSTNKFDCSEVVREIASPVDKPRQQPAILKEIETTSLYTYNPDKDEVHCLQRSAAFLMPSNENVMAMQLWQATRGRAIDVRFYDVTYTRRS